MCQPSARNALGRAAQDSLLRLTLLAPAVVDNLLANPDVAVNLESVLRRVMPMDWRCLQGFSNCDVQR